MKRSKFKVVAAITGLGICLLAYQNCSPKNFSQISATSAAISQTAVSPETTVPTVPTVGGGTTTTTVADNSAPAQYCNHKSRGSSQSSIPVVAFTYPAIQKIVVPQEFVQVNSACLSRFDILTDRSALQNMPNADSTSYRGQFLKAEDAGTALSIQASSYSSLDYSTGGGRVPADKENLLFVASANVLGNVIQNYGSICVGTQAADPYINPASGIVQNSGRAFTLINRSGQIKNLTRWSQNLYGDVRIAGFNIDGLGGISIGKFVVANGNVDLVGQVVGRVTGNQEWPWAGGELELMNGSVKTMVDTWADVTLDKGSVGVVQCLRGGKLELKGGSVELVNEGEGTLKLTGGALKSVKNFTGQIDLSGASLNAITGGSGQIILRNGARAPASIPTGWTVVNQ